MKKPNFSRNSEILRLQETVRTLAANILTSKQREILFLLAQEIQEKNITQAVNTLEKRVSCAQSTIWHNLRKLRAYGIICYKSKNQESTENFLTEIGKAVYEELRKQEEIKHEQRQK